MRYLKRFGQKVLQVFLACHKFLEETKIMTMASSLAYLSLLSFVPFILVSFGLLHAIGGSQQLLFDLRPFFIENLGQELGEGILSNLGIVLSKVKLKALGLTGLAALVVTCMALLFNIEQEVQAIWKLKQQRSIIQRIANYWLIITFGPVGMSFILGTLTKNSDYYFPFFSSWFTGFKLYAIPFLFVMYKWIPEKQVSWFSSLVSAVFTTLVWLIIQGVFIYYMKNVVSYDKIYGSLAIIPMFMVWIYMVWVIFLLGVWLSVHLESRYLGFIEENKLS